VCTASKAREKGRVQGRERERGRGRVRGWCERVGSVLCGCILLRGIRGRGYSVYMYVCI
jgi:hypothetical protein